MECATLASAHVKNKIIEFTELKNYVDTNTRIVQSHGVFDLLHIGHIKHFQAAKLYGDVLIVTITPDRYVNKGSNRPRFTEKLRAEAVAALDCVNFVIINKWPTAVEAIQLIHPYIYVKGGEYQDASQDITGKIEEEMQAVKLVGGKTIFTNELTFSSSSLLNEFFSPFSDQVINYLSNFKKRYNFSQIASYIEKCKTIKVLLVGETIIDDYRFSDVIGKAGKEPTLVAKYKYGEIYPGGILAIANHLSDFCQEITCLTYLGENKEFENLIHNSIAPNVRLIPIYKKKSPTIVKRRFLDEYLKQKLFEEYEINDDFLDEEQNEQFLQISESLLNENDLTIVADYGHGLLNHNAISHLTMYSKFLAVNTQANAGNHGFHFISKYSKADYVVVALRELQLNYRQRHLSVIKQLGQLMLDYEYGQAMITCGKDGAYICKRNEIPVQTPAFDTGVVDRVGAGDTVLSISTLLAYLDAPPELIAFTGNIAGAEAVKVMGNKKPISKTGLMKHIAHLLK